MHRDRERNRAADSDWPKESPLRKMGYRVGKTGKQIAKRRAILQDAFEGLLPTVESQEYMDQWGQPGSPARLGKMATSIAAHCRHAKNAHPDSHREAIEDWEDDLAWLKQMFFDGQFQFRWPETDV